MKVQHVGMPQAHHGVSLLDQELQRCLQLLKLHELDGHRRLQGFASSSPHLEEPSASDGCSTLYCLPYACRGNIKFCKV